MVKASTVAVAALGVGGVAGLIWFLFFRPSTGYGGGGAGGGGGANLGSGTPQQQQTSQQQTSQQQTSDGGTTQTNTGIPGLTLTGHYGPFLAFNATPNPEAAALAYNILFSKYNIAPITAGNAAANAAALVSQLKQQVAIGGTAEFAVNPLTGRTLF